MNKAIDKEMSAFPTLLYVHGGKEDGMTLRDYFAAKAMQALIARETKLNPDLMMYAGAAYDVADAMLEAREK